MVSLYKTQPTAQDQLISMMVVIQDGHYQFIYTRYLDLFIKRRIVTVMALLDKIIKKEPEQDPNKLMVQELQLALTLLKQSTIKGEQIEAFYNLVIKLQNQYIELTKG